MGIRRARRAKIAAQVDRELPGLSEGKRRRVLEKRLREQAAIEAEDLVRRRKQARAEQARRDAARAAAQERAEREREAAAAADAVRQAQPCGDCGKNQAAGLCEACDHRRQTETLIGEAGLLAAAWSADLTDLDNLAAVVAEVRTAIGNSIATAWQEFLQITDVAALEANPEAAEDAYAFAAFQTAQQAVQEYRDNALAMLGRTEEAKSRPGGRTRPSRAAPGSSTTRPVRRPSPPRRRPPTPPGSASPSTCWRCGWSSCASSRRRPAPRRPRPRRGQTGSPGLPRVRWTAVRPGR
ncbi:hypothetical protein [Streptomyces sp. NPDC051132]|uniref:hypothetical protein n=1 Tax=unclassified Streptomyces TaxID=2593676 RepID=UPI00341539D4